MDEIVDILDKGKVLEVPRGHQGFDEGTFGQHQGGVNYQDQV